MIGSWVVARRTCCWWSSRAPLPCLTGDLLFVVFLWCVPATHGLPFQAPVYRVSPCRDPLGCSHIQGDVTTKRQPCVVVCVCLVKSSCVVVMIVVVDLSCGQRWIALVSCTPPRLVRYACSAREALIDQLMFARSIARGCASSTPLLRVQVHVCDRERDFLEIRCVSRRCSGLVRPDSSCSRAPSTRRYACSTLSFSAPRLPRPCTSS